MADRTCSICSEPHHANGYCRAHNHRNRRYGDPLGGPRAPYSPRPDHCTVEDCGRSVQARGYCWKHYLNWRRHGVPVPLPIEPTYSTVHNRLRRERGPASGYDCVDCGGPATDWSFDEPDGYSADLSRYQPRCRGCHLLRDGNARR